MARVTDSRHSPLGLFSAFRRLIGRFNRRPVDEHGEDSGAGHGDAARDAVMARPGTVFVLQTDELRPNLGIPTPAILFRPYDAGCR